MSKSPILGITEIAPTQDNKSITHNDAVKALEAASNAILAFSAIGAGPVTLTEAQATGNMVFTLVGGSAAFNVVFPSQINTVNAKRVFAVRNNDTTYDATIKASTGSGTTVVVKPGEGALIVQDYEDMTLLSSAPVVTANPYDIGVYVPSLPDDGAELLKFIAVRGFSLADDFAASRGHVGTNPTASAIFTVKKNGASIGTVTVSTGGVFTFNTTGATAETFVAGDYLSLEAPSPQDATMADISIIFFGVRT